MICHVSPDAGWPTLENFISGTRTQLKVSLYDFTSAHVLQLFKTKLGGAKLQLTLDDPPRNPTANQTDRQTVQALEKAFAAKFDSAWALVRSSPEADSWMFPTAYHIKVMVRDSDAVWLSSGNLNNSNQPEIHPIGDPQPTDQNTAKQSDRDWHVVIESPELAKTFEAIWMETSRKPLCMRPVAFRFDEEEKHSNTQTSQLRAGSDRQVYVRCSHVNRRAGDDNAVVDTR
jgi:hypothetical protein